MRQEYLDGHASFPNKRINYPDNLEDEKYWLEGYYQASKENELSQLDMDGSDTFLWYYKEG